MANTRNLVVGCDGTWNDTDEPAHTNVVKILNACATTDQITHYEEGVGTAHWEALPGGIYGKGLDRQILGAYRFLVRRFADSDWAHDQNKIFIFGFSRGAYAARRLAGLITHSGIATNSDDVDLAWQLYSERDKDGANTQKQQGKFFDAPVEMLGVWDTVKTTTDGDYDDSTLPGSVVAGYHAMAIDEHRKFFPVLKWDEEPRVKQVWFCGVHSDVGGGYKECQLSDICLQWMVDHACKHGLNFKASAINELHKDACGVQHESYQGIWKEFGITKRAIDTISAVHTSVKERIEKVTDYNPDNLPPEPKYEA